MDTNAYLSDMAKWLEYWTKAKNMNSSTVQVKKIQALVWWYYEREIRKPYIYKQKYKFLSYTVALEAMVNESLGILVPE